jgi:hypothetical protein
VRLFLLPLGLVLGVALGSAVARTALPGWVAAAAYGAALAAAHEGLRARPIALAAAGFGLPLLLASPMQDARADLVGLFLAPGGGALGLAMGRATCEARATARLLLVPIAGALLAGATFPALVFAAVYLEWPVGGRFAPEWLGAIGGLAGALALVAAIRASGSGARGGPARAAPGGPAGA